MQDTQDEKLVLDGEIILVQAEELLEEVALEMDFVDPPEEELSEILPFLNKKDVTNGAESRDITKTETN